MVAMSSCPAGPLCPCTLLLLGSLHTAMTVTEVRVFFFLFLVLFEMTENQLEILNWNILEARLVLNVWGCSPSSFRQGVLSREAALP